MNRIFGLFVLSMSLTCVQPLVDSDFEGDVQLDTVCASTVLDRVDLDSILKNDRLVTNYLKCFMDEGHCTPEGRTAKKLIPEIMRTQCKQCSAGMAKIVRKIMKHMFERRPQDVDRFFTKYDPQKIYYDDLVVFMNQTPQ